MGGPSSDRPCGWLCRGWCGDPTPVRHGTLQCYTSTHQPQAPIFFVGWLVSSSFWFRQDFQIQVSTRAALAEVNYLNQLWKGPTRNYPPSVCRWPFTLHRVLSERRHRAPARGHSRARTGSKTRRRPDPGSSALPVRLDVPPRDDADRQRRCWTADIDRSLGCAEQPLSEGEHPHPQVSVRKERRRHMWSAGGRVHHGPSTRAKVAPCR